MAVANPHPAFHFSVEAGLSRVGFARVLLPTMERELIRYRDGSDLEETARLLPGLLRLGPCVLERGVVPPDDEFFVWLNTISVGSVQRRDVVVRLLDASHAPAMVWQLRRCFPTRLAWSPLDADCSAVLIETLSLAVESMSVETP